MYNFKRNVRTLFEQCKKRRLCDNEAFFNKNINYEHFLY